MSLLRHQVTVLFLAPSPVVLQVGTRWVVLDHGGSFTDRAVPGTDLLCPFLERGSEVRVMVQVPASSSADVRRAVVAREIHAMHVISFDGYPSPYELVYGRQPVDPPSAVNDLLRSPTVSAEDQAITPLSPSLLFWQMLTANSPTIQLVMTMSGDVLRPDRLHGDDPTPPLIQMKGSSGQILRLAQFVPIGTLVRASGLCDQNLLLTTCSPTGVTVSQ